MSWSIEQLIFDMIYLRINFIETCILKWAVFELICKIILKKIQMTLSFANKWIIYFVHSIHNVSTPFVKIYPGGICGSTCSIMQKYIRRTLEVLVSKYFEICIGIRSSFLKFLEVLGCTCPLKSLMSFPLYLAHLIVPEKFLYPKEINVPLMNDISILKGNNFSQNFLT